MPLHFVPITEENRREVENLQLFPEQRSYIESVPECLAEAEQTREWRTVGIYDGPTVVGFAMYGCFAQPEPEGQLWLDRLLIETDCPYMAPEPYRGKRCDSTMLPRMAEKLAEIKGVSPQRLADQTFENACAVYRIPASDLALQG